MHEPSMVATIALGLALGNGIILICYLLKLAWEWFIGILDNIITGYFDRKERLQKELEERERETRWKESKWNLGKFPIDDKGE